MSANGDPSAKGIESQEVTKRTVRQKVWDYMEKNELCNFPRPATGRIPNFKGAEEAARRLADLEVFKAAKVIKVNPDKPQEPVRFLSIEAKKSVLVPIPRLRTGLFQLVELPDDAVTKDVKIAASRRGAEQFGVPLGLDAKIKVDLVVMGAVAVSKEGRRIGKGEGFTDLEFALMAGMGAVTSDTIVVTTVDDCQVYDTLPKDLFQAFDVPVDIIVTPTQVIYVSTRLPKPKGVIWGMLSSRRLNSIALLQTFRDNQIEQGRDCTLKEVESDVEERPPRSANGRGDGRPRFRRRRVRSTKSGSDENGELVPGKRAGEGDEEGHPQRPTRTFRRRRNSARKPKEGVDGVEATDEEKGKPERRRRPVRLRQRPAIEFSLRVSNIAADVRVRDLKAALAERGVKPTDITWRGHRGFAFLHFANAKPAPTHSSDSEAPPPPSPSALDSNSIVASLQDLKLGPEGGDEAVLKVEAAKPVTRIETTDITAV